MRQIETLRYRQRYQERTRSSPESKLNLTFLVVDDEPDNRLVVLTILNHLGHRVLESGSALEALEVLAIQPIDVLLLDLQMPAMDGLELLRLLRSRPETRDMPVICISAHAKPQDQALAFEAGADGYVVKPFSRRNLIQALDHLRPRIRRLPESFRFDPT